MRKMRNTVGIALSEADAPPWLNRKIRMFPMWIFQGYLSLTVFVFAFGPWPWPVPDPVILYVFLLAAQFALWIGYRSGLKSHSSSYYGPWKIDNLITISLVTNLIWILPNYMLRMGLSKISVANIVTSISTGVLDPGAMYEARMEALTSVVETSFLNYTTQLISPILWLLVPLAIVYWSRLNWTKRSLFLLFVVTDLLTWVAMGTNKGIADYVLLVPWLAVAAHPEIIQKIRIFKVIRIFIYLAIALLLLTSYFTIGQRTRGGGEIPFYDRSANIAIDNHNWMVRFLRPAGQGAVAAITSYMVQGYYGLALALTEPFDTTYGVGNSHYYTGIVESFLGQGSISDKTYPAKIEKYGWDRFGRWQSVYTWIASDVSFPGAIVVVFLIGRLFGMVWLDVLHRVNPFAVALFGLLVIMLFYFPANNQVLAFSRSANAFWVVFFAWIVTRRRYVW